jgi:hypothetical protein
MNYVSRETKRVMWMAEFDLAVVNRFPALSGRISWVDATHMFNIGMGPQDAADKYLLNPNNLPENAVRLVHF